MSASQLTVSIVSYFSDGGELSNTLDTLDKALAQARTQPEFQHLRCTVILLDNSDDKSDHNRLSELLAHWHRQANRVIQPQLHSSGKNLGYGSANNLAVRLLNKQTASPDDFLLILNPDVELDPDALHRGLRYLVQHKNTCAVLPRAFNDNGADLYLAHRHPSVLVLALRAVPIKALIRRFSAQLDRYELRDLDADQIHHQTVCASGSFILTRSSQFARIGGFDARYFLYFEDYDLGIRLKTGGAITYLPSMRIKHHGGAAVRKGWHHRKFFVASAWRFFQAHGWKWI